MRGALLRCAIHSTYYPSLWISRFMSVLRRWDWWNLVDETVILGAVPSRKDLRALRELNVRAVVNLCEEFAGYPDVLAECGMEQLHLPTLDYHSPTRSDLRKGIEFILEQSRRRGRVYVHCKAGRGRSPTLVLCYLMMAHRIGALEAYQRLKAARPHISANLHRLPLVRELEIAIHG